MNDTLLTLANLYFILLNFALPLALFTKKYTERLPFWVLATSAISPAVAMVVILPISYLSAEAFQVLPWLMPPVTWLCQLIGFVACLLYVEERT